MASELKPCPFCGAPDDEIMIFADPEEATDNSGPSRRVQCAVCNIEAPFYPSEAEAIAAWNTRPAPAATDTGLVTVAWESMDKKRDPNDKLVYEVKFPRNGDKRLVYKSQAEALLAAERAEKEEARRAEEEAKDCFWSIYETYLEKGGLPVSTEGARSALSNRIASLEAKLAAANEVAQLVIQAEEDKSGDPNFYILLMQTAYDKARAVLGGKPS